MGDFDSVERRNSGEFGYQDLASFVAKKCELSFFGFHLIKTLRQFFVPEQFVVVLGKAVGFVTHVLEQAQGG